MNIHITTTAHLADRKAADILVLPFWQGSKKAEPAADMPGELAVLKSALEAGDFQGKQGEILILYPRGKEKRIALLGLGKEEECTLSSLRTSYATLTKAALSKKNEHLNVAVPKTKKISPSPLAVAVCEGILMANYRFDYLKKETLVPGFKLLSGLCFIGVSKEAFAAVLRAAEIMTSVNYVRDLVNGNADDVTPQKLAECARALQKTSSAIKTTVLEKKQLEKEKLGLLLAVGRAAAVDPMLALVEYRGNPSSKQQTALVGKGITYDTGGLRLKQTGMETMKEDMTGAAIVLGTIRAAAALKLKVNLIGVIPSAENAIGPKSYKMGDVYRSYSGKTVEVNDTDAEGRLVLADAISYVQHHYKPDTIIDFATLTGAIVICLGEEATGLFSNDDALAKGLIAAGEKTGERLWRLPLFAEYQDKLKSSIADLKNSGGRPAGSCTAAMFLQSFLREAKPPSKQVSWAHLDVAGTAYLSEAKPLHPTPATGVGVRLIIEWLVSR